MRTVVADVHGVRVAVTGASRGLGLAMARALVQGGAQVLLGSRDPSAVQAAAESLEKLPGTAVSCALDVARSAVGRAIPGPGGGGVGRP